MMLRIMSPPVKVAVGSPEWSESAMKWEGRRASGNPRKKLKKFLKEFEKSAQGMCFVL